MRLTLVSVLLLLTPGYAAASSGAASKNAENLAGHARPLQSNSLARPIRVVAQAISSQLPIGAASKNTENLAGHARPLQSNSLARPIRVVAQAISSQLPIGAASKN